MAEPVARATLSTRLMGSVTEVLVREGDRVRNGQLLARIDARDLEARRGQVDAGIAGAEALYQDARTQAERSGPYMPTAPRRAISSNRSKPA
jgi:multidrug efflux pump subunit AcrA (membrane-fusion protein)